MYYEKTLSKATHLMVLSRKLRKDIFFYFASSLLAFIAHYGVLILLAEVLAINPLFATTVGFLFGTVVSYSFNYKITFVSSSSHAYTLSRFLMVASVGLGLNTLIFLLSFKLITPNYIFSQLIATCIVFIWSFAANKAWTFRKKKYHM